MTATDVNGDSDCHKVDAKEYASPVPTERLRDLKRQDTHRRLVDVGYRMINQRGYVETTTADIAAAAGVTERTFFRHFASKGEVIIDAWRGLAAELADAVHGAPGTDSPIDVVRAGLHAFTREFASDNDTTRANARTLWANRQLVMLLLDVVIDCEQHIARRTGEADGPLRQRSRRAHRRQCVDRCPAGGDPGGPCWRRPPLRGRGRRRRARPDRTDLSARPLTASLRQGYGSSPQCASASRISRSWPPVICSLTAGLSASAQLNQARSSASCVGWQSPSTGTT